MILEPIQDYLSSEGLGVIGESLFILSMPAKTVRGVLLLEDLGGTPIDHELQGLRKGHFQVIVRNPDYLAGMELARRIAVVLGSERRRALGGYWFRYMRARHEPVAYPTSDGQNREFSVNYDACYEV